MADGQTKTPQQRQAERDERRRQNAKQRRAYRARTRQRRAAAGGGSGPATTEPDSAHGRGRPRMRQGVVVSDKAAKTVVVRVDTTRQHRVYKKTVRESTNLHAHDERDEARAGDTVRVVESRPLSATKRWRLVEVVERGR